MKTVRLYTVVFDDPRRNDGLSDTIARFRRRSDAEEFAGKHTHYGKPATVEIDDVPVRLADRWSMQGKMTS